MNSGATGDRRAAILAIAERHFSASGYQGASLSAIAREAGLGNPGLLYHFPSKAKLYRAVLESIAEDVTRHLEDGLAGAAPRAALELLVAEQFAFFDRRPAGFRVVQRELLDNAERVQLAHVLPLKAYLERALGVIKAGQAGGTVRRDLQPAAVLTLVLGTTAYAATVRPTFAESLDRAELGAAADWPRTIVDTVLRTISADPVH
ncbi:HTH-type transcriptional repressor NicS [bacterium YEK0313]|nr:HTH-type transcriptional repressor NicS [bacterium YEK0313]